MEVPLDQRFYIHLELLRQGKLDAANKLLSKMLRYCSARRPDSVNRLKILSTTQAMVNNQLRCEEHINKKKDL